MSKEIIQCYACIKGYIYPLGCNNVICFDRCDTVTNKGRCPRSDVKNLYHFYYRETKRHFPFFKKETTEGYYFIHFDDSLLMIDDFIIEAQKGMEIRKKKWWEIFV